MASQNQTRKNPQFPESARAFTTALGAPRAAFPSSVTCGTPPRVICISVRGVGATARRAVDLHPALFSLLCRERVHGCGQSWQHCHMRASVDPGGAWIRRLERSTSLRGLSRRPRRAHTPRSAPHDGQLGHVYDGLWGKDTQERSCLLQTAAGLWRSVHGLAGRLQRDHRPQS